MTTSRWAGALALLGALPMTMAAQADQLPALSPQCPAGAAPKVDSTAVTIGIWPSKKWRDESYDEAQRQRMQYYADGIRQHFVAPASLGELPVLGEGFEKGGGIERSVLGGSVALIVTPEGRLSKIAWEQSPLSIPLANAITSAATAADSAGAFDGIPRRRNALDTLSLNIGAWTQRVPEKAAALLRARTAAYVVESDANLLRRVPPEYPENAKRNFAENVTVVTFIVGSDGKAHMPSFQAIRTDFRDFEAPIRTAVGEATYRPARSGGCAVPRLVSQQFDFRMHRPDE